MALTYSNFWIRLTNWEYWPMPVVYIPIYIYWFWLSIRAKSFFFFTASNPGIEFGGMLGESKMKIMNILPTELIPKTIYISASSTPDQVDSLMTKHQLTYPIILKPDIGERGWQVELIKHRNALNDYIHSNNVNLLLQEYIDKPVELGVFYYRFPREDKGRITSIVEKGLLKVTGDGTSSVHQLLQVNPRGKLQIKRLLKTRPQLMAKVPLKDEEFTVVSIGNHRLGTAFLDGNKYINDKITKVFDQISNHIKGFYFGRFDLRCRSIQDLEQGKMKILELNGAGAEPAHIYHPGASIWTGYQVLFHHWKIMFQISLINHNGGIPYLRFSEGMKAIRSLMRYNRQKTANS